MIPKERCDERIDELWRWLTTFIFNEFVSSVALKFFSLKIVTRSTLIKNGSQ